VGLNFAEDGGIALAGDGCGAYRCGRQHAACVPGERPAAKRVGERVPGPVGEHGKQAAFLDTCLQAAVSQA
jgi:hypothetical protein